MMNNHEIDRPQHVNIKCSTIHPHLAMALIQMGPILPRFSGWRVGMDHMVPWRCQIGIQPSKLASDDEKGKTHFNH